MFKANKEQKQKNGIHTNPSKQKSETHSLAKENKKQMKLNYVGSKPPSKTTL